MMPTRSPLFAGLLLAAPWLGGAWLAGAWLVRAAPLAAEEAPAPAAQPLTRGDLELLPLNEVALLRFQRANADLVARAEIVLRRAERVEEQLRERAEDAGAKALWEERSRLARQGQALVPEIEARLAAAGVAPGALDRARAAPRGPLRAERFGRAQVLALLAGSTGDAVETRALALFTRLVPLVDGAVLALHAEVARLKTSVGEPAEDRQALAVELEQRRREVERRFWRLVYWCLSEDRRASLAERLPRDLLKHDDAIAHVYLLRGLTPSQGVAFKSLLLELEAEAAADTSELKRVTDALARPTLAADERRLEEQALKACQERLAELQLAAFDRGLALLTPEQARELKELPPYLSGPERSRRLEETLEGIVTTPEQRLLLAALARRYAEHKQRFERGALDVQRRLKDAGPDSPERELAEMMYVGLSGDAAAVLREAHGEVFLTILTPEQVEGWVLGLPAR